MERERPEYLPPIERRRWEFPWLAVLAIALLALLVGGAHMLTKTHAAWNERFRATDTATADPAPQTQVLADAEREAMLAEIRLKRAAAEAEAKSAEQRRRLETPELRCINGMLFRRIPGGWENITGQSC